jgi:hypothetical protein
LFADSPRKSFEFRFQLGEASLGLLGALAFGFSTLAFGFSALAFGSGDFFLRWH